MTADGSTAHLPDEAAITALIAKQQITEVLYRRARAGDRRDIKLALACYHGGATEDHEGHSGPAADFILNASMISPDSAAPVTCLWHFISNVLIDLAGDEADVESYHIAVVVRDEDSGQNTVPDRRPLPGQIRISRRTLGHRRAPCRLRLEPSGTRLAGLLGPGRPRRGQAPERTVRGRRPPLQPSRHHSRIARFTCET